MLSLGLLELMSELSSKLLLLVPDSLKDIQLLLWKQLLLDLFYGHGSRVRDLLKYFPLKVLNDTAFEQVLRRLFPLIEE